MSDSFVPHSSSDSRRGATEPFQLRVVQGSAANALPFKPVAFAAAPHPSPSPVNEPKVTLVRDGDTITHIRVQCGCGEVMELRCVY